MIEELRDRYCITQSVKDTVGYSSFSSSSASYQIVARTQTSSTEDQKTTDKFSFSSNYPAYFSAFNESKTAVFQIRGTLISPVVNRTLEDLFFYLFKRPA
jgi:hypothetical protein